MSDSEEEYEEYFSQKLNTIVAIDCSPEMFSCKLEENGKSAFYNAIQALHFILDRLLLATQAYHKFTIVLYSDKLINLLEDADNILQAYEKLSKIIADSDHGDNNLELYQRKPENADFAGFLRELRKNCIKSNQKNRLVLLTMDSSPCRDDAQQTFAALNEFQNFRDLYFDLVTMDSDFNYSKFYQELFRAAHLPVTENIAQDLEGLQEFFAGSISPSLGREKLTFYYDKADLGKSCECVKLKFIAKERKLLKNLHVTLDEGLKVVRQKRDVASYLLNGDIPLTKEERDQVFQEDEPIGFLLLRPSRERLFETGMVIHQPWFICNADEAIKEDNKVDWFDEMWRSCVKNHWTLLCHYKRNRIHLGREVELEPKSINGKKMFLVHTLPNCCELEQLEELLKGKDNNPADKANNDDLDLMKRFIEFLEFEYDPAIFSNPSYAKKAAFLKAKLLNQEPEEVVECAVNDQEIEQRLQDVLPQLLRKFADESRSTSGKGSQNKKQKL